MPRKNSMDEVVSSAMQHQSAFVPPVKEKPNRKMEIARLTAIPICLALSVYGADLLNIEDDTQQLAIEGVFASLAYCFFYDSVNYRLRKMQWFNTKPEKYAHDTVEYAVRSVPTVAMIHQLLVCGGLLYAMYAISSNTEYSGTTLYGWWTGGWHVGCETLHTVTRHSLYATFGFELKDLWADGMTIMFWIHHVTVFVGVFICLSFNAGAGLVVVNGAVAELGSGFYNSIYVFPKSTIALWLYTITMVLSNLWCAWTMYVLSTLPEAQPTLVWVYLGLTIILEILRSGGIYLELSSRCACCLKKESSKKSQ